MKLTIEIYCLDTFDLHFRFTEMCVFVRDFFLKSITYRV